MRLIYILILIVGAAYFLDARQEEPKVSYGVPENYV